MVSGPSDGVRGLMISVRNMDIFVNLKCYADVTKQTSSSRIAQLVELKANSQVFWASWRLKGKYSVGKYLTYFI